MALQTFDSDQLSLHLQQDGELHLWFIVNEPFVFYPSKIVAESMARIKGYSYKHISFKRFWIEEN